jgi:2-amino-4-hydroxy-6-hydroxymethyldihydropteridine diphosphokinase
MSDEQNKETTVYLGLGANLGDREGNIARALEMLREKVTVGKVSPLYETDPVGYLNQPAFLNAACKGDTALAPDDLLSFVKGIEKRLGREPSFANAPRHMDIDILLYDDLIMESSVLTIPHPRMKERAFVLVPLADIAPDLMLPGEGVSVSQAMDNVSKAGVRLWQTPSEDQGGRNVRD